MASENLISRLRNVSFARTILPVLAVVAIIIAILLVATGQPDRTQDGAAVTPPRASAAFGNAPTVAGAGVVEPSSEVIDIGTSLSGLVTKVFVTPGQQVERGAPLFAVDDRAVRSQINEANAAIARAQSARAAARTALVTAEQQLALFSGIDDKRAISRAELIDRQGAVRAARSQIAQAEAEIRSARAMRTSAQTDLGRLLVRAPIAAEILSVNIRAGEYISTGGSQGGGNSAPYMEIGNTRPKHVRIDIDENEISRVKIGSEAIVSPRGNSDIRATATFVRAEPLVTPKVSLTNSASERVDVRVLQLIYQLPEESNFVVGQQVDAFVRAIDQAKSRSKTGTPK